MKLLWSLATIACVSSLSAYALAQGMGPPGGGPQGRGSGARAQPGGGPQGQGPAAMGQPGGNPQGQGPAAMGQPGGNPAGPGAVGQSAPPGAGHPGNRHRAGRGEHAGGQPFNP